MSRPCFVLLLSRLPFPCFLILPSWIRGARLLCRDGCHGSVPGAVASPVPGDLVVPLPDRSNRFQLCTRLLLPSAPLICLVSFPSLPFLPLFCAALSLLCPSPRVLNVRRHNSLPASTRPPHLAACPPQSLAPLPTGPLSRSPPTLVGQHVKPAEGRAGSVHPRRCNRPHPLLPLGRSRINPSELGVTPSIFSSFNSCSSSSSSSSSSSCCCSSSAPRDLAITLNWRWEGPAAGEGKAGEVTGRLRRAGLGEGAESPSCTNRQPKAATLLGTAGAGEGGVKGAWGVSEGRGEGWGGRSSLMRQRLPPSR